MLNEETRDRVKMIRSLQLKLFFFEKRQVPEMTNLLRSAIEDMSSANIKNAMSIYNNVMIKTDHYIVEKVPF